MIPTTIPDGSFTLSKRPAAFPSDVWGQVRSADGATLTTSDGKNYLDCMCALGALTVGHNHPQIVAAVERQVRLGAIFSLPSLLEQRVADRLTRVIPCAEQVRVVKTGSEACSAAVRIARLATGRELILTSKTSYHGWHDALIAAKPRHPGVPDCFPTTIATFPYNDLDELEFKLSMRNTGIEKDRVAAVMLEPVQGEPPQPGYLHGVVSLAHKYGALVIFDEMLCGGRLALAGAQEYYGVTPDLATFGKALGGGLPFAFVCGKADVMKHAWPISGTFSGDALALAAADAMLTIYDTEPVIDTLWKHGGLWKHRILSEAKAAKWPLKMFGHDPRFWFDFSNGVDERLAKSVFVQQCAREHILVHPAVVFASAALTVTEASYIGAAFGRAVRFVFEHAENLKDHLVGDMYEDSVR